MADAAYTELNIGQIRPTPKGTWSATQAYNYLDIVKDTTASYIAVFLTGVPAGISTTNTTYWQPLAEDGKDANEFTFATETKILLSGQESHQCNAHLPRPSERRPREILPLSR